MPEALGWSKCGRCCLSLPVDCCLEAEMFWPEDSDEVGQCE